MRRGLLAGAAVLALVIPPGLRGAPDRLGTSVAAPSIAAASSSQAAPDVVTRPPRFADFGSETPSPDARHVANWVADSSDNANASFVIVDKKRARLYLFDPRARLRAATPVLLGAARGDDSAPGIGSRPIAEVRPDERTTPAGRFVAERGHDVSGDDVVWVDYDAAVSMHRVVTTNPRERRLARLATPSIDDNRISYGCINVPRAFYESYIRPTFATHRAIVYVLPDVKTVQQVFGSYDVAESAGRRVAARANSTACSGPACAVSAPPSRPSPPS
ncbi:MAG: hypothetical protein ABIP61_12685 [Burkholderiaceae bacterium]